MLAGILILQRADELRISRSQPLGVFRHENGSLAYMNGPKIQKTLACAVQAAYPDKSHIAYEVINKFSAHSLRCTAAMALISQGLSIEVVAHRLRWNSDAIKRYLREARLSVDEITAVALAGSEIIA